MAWLASLEVSGSDYVQPGWPDHCFQSKMLSKRATAAVPIVFAVGEDPVALGLVDSIAAPGGRLTGFHYLTNRAIIIIKLPANLARQNKPLLYPIPFACVLFTINFINDGHSVSFDRNYVL